MSDLLEIDNHVIEHMIDLNVHSPCEAAIQVAKSMNYKGRMIIVGSVNADRIPMTGAFAYALTKSAIQGLVKGMAVI